MINKYKPKLKDEDKVLKILEMHKNGIRSRDIAKEIGVTYSSIKSFLIKRGLKPISPSNRLQIDAVTKEIHSLGYDFDPSTFKRTRDPLDIICHKHGVFKKRINDLRRGSGCPKCGFIKIAQHKRTSYEDLSKILKDKKFKPLFTEQQYRDGEIFTDKMHIQCHCGRDFYPSLQRMKDIKSCWDCSSSAPPDFNNVREFFENNGLQLPDQEYKNANTPLIAICPIHGEIPKRLNDLKDGHGCLKCGALTSKSEIELSDKIKELGFEVINNDRQVLDGKEIDIWIPSLNLGIEYSGLKWHSEETYLKKLRDIKMSGITPTKETLKKLKELKFNIRHKHDLAESKGVNLITIFEDEWVHNKEATFNFIKSKLGVTAKLYTRQVEIFFPNKEETNSFMDTWHIQKSCSYLYAVGLKHKGEIVAISTIGRHHRNSKEIAIKRVCFGRYSVSGGFGKMLKYLIIKAKELGYDEITTWSDNRLSDGNMYKSLGFNQKKKTKHDYFYFKKQRRINKQSLKKDILIKKGGIGKTEYELALSLGLFRIHDAGKITWVLDIKDL